MILLLCILLFNNCNCNDVCDKYNKFTVGVPCSFGQEGLRWRGPGEVGGDAALDAGGDAALDAGADADEAILDADQTAAEEEAVVEEPAAEETEAEREQARCNPFTTIERESKAAFSSCGYTRFDPSKADVGGISDIWLRSYYNERDPCGVEWSEYNDAHDNTRMEGCPVIEQYPRNDWRVCLDSDHFPRCLSLG